MKEYFKEHLVLLWDYISEGTNGKLLSILIAAVTTLYIDVMLVFEWISLFVFGQVIHDSIAIDLGPWISIGKDIIASVVAVIGAYCLWYNTFKKKIKEEPKQ